MFDVKKIRRALIWGIPLFLGLAAGCLWMTADILVTAIVNVVNRASAVRITPGVWVAPFCAAFSLLGIIVGCLRAVPVSDHAIKPFERAFQAAVLGGVVAMFLIPATSVIQRFYMPGIGYSMCSELEGHPTMWFTDWVRDPAWCAKGKSLEWVNEQARIARHPGKP
ncbi:hypothetical protein [Acidovorax sp. BLS4]|uniref:hypothetical protein n=1 Tax=Acidovorax sp. BLS4 TaxID=3273430 RepID=UPI002941D514|nr:hypothetical protein [Paracidovorax avenae]WOI46024.1 hypothetical protein R1Z03_02070 [Paracidovorax avenae]